MDRKRKIKKVVKVTVIGIIAFITLFLISITLLQLNSMNKIHSMQEIVYEPVQPTYWPTQAWQISSPEKHCELIGYSSKGKWVLTFNNNKIEIRN